MKTVFQLILLLSVTIARSQQADTINRVDENGLKQGLWIRYYDATSSIKSKGFYLDNVPEGPYWRYFENGQLKETGKYNKQNHIGQQVTYYENGQLESIRNFSEDGQMKDTAFYFSSNGNCARKEIQQPNSRLLTSIQYKDNEQLPDTMITVIADSKIKRHYTLTEDFKLPTDDSLSARQFSYKLTYETTPIFQEYLLTLYNDSTYSIVRYVYESCYNYIDKSYGTWESVGNAVQLRTLNGFSFSHSLKNNQWKELIGVPQQDASGKNRSYVFSRLQL